MKKVPFNTLLGKTITKIKNINIDTLDITCSDGTQYRQYHQQDCCESVYIDSITGDLKDLLNNPILLAEETTNNDEPPKDIGASYTWTFYKLATIKGYVDIRWYGESNGYYSESVDLYQIN